MRYVQLQKVSINPYTKMSKNETVSMEEIEGNVFKLGKGATDCKRGRNKERELVFPMTEWDDVYNSHINRGFTPIDDVKRGYREVTQSGDYAPIPDKTFRDVLAEFIKLNQEFFEESYSKNIKEISEENIAIVQKAILDLSQDMKQDVRSFNDTLMNIIWTFVPRRMNHLDRLVAHSQKDYESIIVREQDMLDRLVQELQSGTSADKTLDILTANNIRERRVTDEEFDFIRGLVRSKDANDNYCSNYDLSNAWAVTNVACEDAMNKYLASEGFEIKPDDKVDFNRPGITYLWHGTGKSNIWSIMKSGLYLNPALIKPGVRICGKAYGYGSYFAPYMYKSLGYCGNNFSYDRSLGGNVGYMFIFKVATGNPWYINRERGYAKVPQHWGDFHKDHPGKHCCWAESNFGAGNDNYRLRWDEVIVYQQCQSSMAYIVEIKEKRK